MAGIEAAGAFASAISRRTARNVGFQRKPGPQDRRTDFRIDRHQMPGWKTQTFVRVRCLAASRASRNAIWRAPKPLMARTSQVFPERPGVAGGPSSSLD